MALKRNIISTFLTQFPVLILTLITGVIITRLIGVQGKGIYTIFIANTQLLALFFSFSANSGITYFISKKQITVEKVIGLTFYTFFISAIIGSFIIFIPFHQEKLLLPEGFNNLTFKFYLYFSFLFTMSNTLFSGIFQGFKLYPIINKVAIINAVINIVVFGMLTLNDTLCFFDSLLFNVLFLTLLVYIINTFIWLFFYLKFIKITPEFTLSVKEEVSIFFQYIGLGHTSNVLNFFNYRLDIWFVNSYHGLEQLGLYSLAVNVSKILLMVTTPIASVLFPYLVEEKNNLKKMKLMTLFSRINAFCLALGLISMLLLGKYLIPFVYGEEFKASITTFNIMIFATFFTGMTKTFSTYLASENKVVYNLYATILGFIITVVFNVLLVPKYGILGAAISSVLTYFSIFSFVYFKTKTMNIDIKGLNFFIFNYNDYNTLKTIMTNGKR